MKFKSLLPALAFVSTIGMSFTTVNTKEQASDYIRVNNSWLEIDEQNCSNQEDDPYTCQVSTSVNGPTFDVYDEMDLDTRKTSVSENPNIIELNFYGFEKESTSFFGMCFLI